MVNHSEFYSKSRLFFIISAIFYFAIGCFLVVPVHSSVNIPAGIMLIIGAGLYALMGVNANTALKKARR